VACVCVHACVRACMRTLGERGSKRCCTHRPRVRSPMGGVGLGVVWVVALVPPFHAAGCVCAPCPAASALACVRACVCPCKPCCCCHTPPPLPCEARLCNSACRGGRAAHAGRGRQRASERASEEVASHLHLHATFPPSASRVGGGLVLLLPRRQCARHPPAAASMRGSLSRSVSGWVCGEGGKANSREWECVSGRVLRWLAVGSLGRARTLPLRATAGAASLVQPRVCVCVRCGWLEAGVGGHCSRSVCATSGQSVGWARLGGCCRHAHKRIDGCAR